MIKITSKSPPEQKPQYWRDVLGYEGLYSVSCSGKIYSHITNKFLSPKTDKDGYQAVVLSKDCKTRTFYVHRLVATAFVPNIENKPTVNHKDENKKNNSSTNLEWATISEQISYGKAAIRRRKQHQKPVLIYDKSGNLIKETASIQEAAEYVGVCKNWMIRHLKLPSLLPYINGYKAEYKFPAPKIVLNSAPKKRKRKKKK